MNSESNLTLLHSILDNVPLGIIAVSSTGQILACNGNAGFLLHIKEAEILNKPYAEVLPLHVANVIKKQIDLSSEGEEAEDCQIDYAISANRILKIGVSASSLFDASGSPIGWNFVFRDMSLTLEVESLRTANNILSEMMRVVSHELKSPLTAILQAAEYLLDEPDRLAKDQFKMVSVVNQSGHWINELVSDFLDLSKLEGKQLGLELAKTNLADLIEEVAQVHRGQVNTVVELNLDPHIPPLLIDRKKIHQALENLVSNAIKFSPNRGLVWINTSLSTDVATVSVRDQGVGIPVDQVRYVWDKFFRVDSKETAKIKGTGLGLAITKRIIELHGGTVRVGSEVGVGSVFSITLPLNAGQSTL